MLWYKSTLMMVLNIINKIHSNYLQNNVSFESLSDRSDCIYANYKSTLSLVVSRNIAYRYAQYILNYLDYNIKTFLGNS